MGKREQKRMRTGVIGAGHMGQYHILVYAELWDVDLVGIVDTDAGKAARELGFMARDPADTLRDTVDYVRERVLGKGAFSKTAAG